MKERMLCPFLFWKNFLSPLSCACLSNRSLRSHITQAIPLSALIPQCSVWYLMAQLSFVAKVDGETLADFWVQGPILSMFHWGEVSACLICLQTRPPTPHHMEPAKVRYQSHNCKKRSCLRPFSSLLLSCSTLCSIPISASSPNL